MRRTIALSTSAACTVALVASLTPAGAEQTPDPARHHDHEPARVQVDGRMTAAYPRRVGFPRSTRRALTITSKGWRSTHATLRAWQRRKNGTWRLAYGPVRARLGWNGWASRKNRRQNSGTSPAGVFRIPYAFGRLADPGTRLRYRKFDGNDWWPYEPRDRATYNIYQRHRSSTAHWRPTWAERLMDYRHQYAYAAVVGFNLPRGVHYSKKRHQWVARKPANTSKGGGIFLHVNGDGLTAGCVSMRKRDIRAVLRWLRPKANVRVAMGPRKFLVR